MRELLSGPRAPHFRSAAGAHGDGVPLLSRVFLLRHGGLLRAPPVLALSPWRNCLPGAVCCVVLSNRCKDANQHDPAKSVVRAVSFHPTGELLLAGGFDKTLRLFQVPVLILPSRALLFLILFRAMHCSAGLLSVSSFVGGSRPW